MVFKLDNVKKFSRLWKCKDSVNYKLYTPPPTLKGEFDYEDAYNDLVEQFGEVYLNKKFE